MYSLFLCSLICLSLFHSEIWGNENQENIQKTSSIHQLDYLIGLGIGVPVGNVKIFTDTDEHVFRSVWGKTLGFELRQALVYKTQWSFNFDFRTVYASDASYSQSKLSTLHTKYTYFDFGFFWGFDYNFLPYNILIGPGVGYGLLNHYLIQVTNRREILFHGISYEAHIQKLWWLNEHFTLGLKLFYQRSLFSNGGVIENINGAIEQYNIRNGVVGEHIGLFLTTNFNLHKNTHFR